MHCFPFTLHVGLLPLHLSVSVCFSVCLHVSLSVCLSFSQTRRNYLHEAFKNLSRTYQTEMYKSIPWREKKKERKKRRRSGKQSRKKTIISTWAGLQQQSTPPRPALLECLSACDSIRRSDSIVWCRGKTTGGCEHEGVIDSCLNATARSGTQAAITTENKHHCPCRHEAMECGGERVRPTLKVPFTTANRKQHSVEHQTL